MSAETWETDPTIALAAVERVRFQTDGEGPRERAATLTTKREKLVAEVRDKLADIGDEALSGMYEGALVGGNMMVFRERGKTNVIKAVHEARMTFRELGHRHADAGNLNDAAHIFMLTGDELQLFVDAPSDWTQTLADRSVEWKELWDLEPPFFIKDGQVPPLTEWSRRGEAVVDGVTVGEVITGVPGSPGVIEGTARIVVDPTDPGDLGPGDIMVAPLTDPAWTPLFMATDATARIPDGATIRVDGSTGEVTILTLS